MHNNGQPSLGKSNLQGQELLNDVVQRFVEVLIAAGADVAMIRVATSRALSTVVDENSHAAFTELGSLLRDCMEVMCAWRRDVTLVNYQGDPIALVSTAGPNSFPELCVRTGCEHDWQDVLTALREFGAVRVDERNQIVSQTPTFLCTYAGAGGRLARDGLLKQVEGFLRVLHRNAQSATGRSRSKFERSCTVSVATELEPVFDQLVRTRGQEFVDSIDEWLERHTKVASPSETYLELGAGAYFIDLGPKKPNLRRRA
jgi:hypothetical protein